MLNAGIHVATQGRRTDSEVRGSGAKPNIGTHKWSDEGWVMSDGWRGGAAAVGRSAADSVWWAIGTAGSRRPANAVL